MNKKLLLTTQKDEIFRVIDSTIFAPSEFEWKEIPSNYLPDYLVPKILHKPSGYYCIIDSDWKENYYLRYSPGKETNEAFETILSFEEVPYRIESWLNYLKRELEAPDMWESLVNSRIPDTLSHPEIENTPFTEEELSYISVQLQEIKRFLRDTHRLTIEQSELMEQRLSYVENAAARVGRIDWNNILLGVITNLVVQLALPPEVYGGLFRLVSSIIKKFLGLTVILP